MRWTPSSSTRSPAVANAPACSPITPSGYGTKGSWFPSRKPTPACRTRRSRKWIAGSDDTRSNVSARSATSSPSRYSNSASRESRSPPVTSPASRSDSRACCVGARTRSQKRPIRSKRFAPCSDPGRAHLKRTVADQQDRCAAGRWLESETHGFGSRRVEHAAAVVKQVLLAATVSLHPQHTALRDRKSTRLNSSHSQISYAVFCLKKKTLIASHLR